MTTDTSKILILYANYGEGHKSAAYALQESIQLEMPNATIVTEDFLGQAFPRFDLVMRKLYLQTFHWAKPVYRYLYYRTKDYPADAHLFQFLSLIGLWKLDDYIEKHKPTLVISTFPFLTGMLAKIKERGDIPFSLWCVLTDYVTHSQWLYKSVDQYFIPTEDIQSDIIRSGIDISSILATGIPISLKFYNDKNKQGLIHKWNLRQDQKIVLLSSGAFGVLNVEEVCKALLDACPSTQFLVVCGRNTKLYEQMIELRDMGYDAIHPLPFVKEMDELMYIADVFITKAGGLSTSEAIASKVPMVLYRSLPGQETENAKHLTSIGVARTVQTETELIQTVSQLVSNEQILRQMKENFTSIECKTPSALQIAKMVNHSFENHEFIFVKPKALKRNKLRQLFYKSGSKLKKSI